MADTVTELQYFYIQVPNKPGEGARALTTLKEAGVNLLAFSGFPEGRRAQLDFVPEDPAAFRRAAKAAGWKVTGPKRALLVQGDDRIGVIADLVDKLASAEIDIIATDAVCAGGGRYGAIIWVDQRKIARAAKLLAAG
jgi:hypothetical protein